jgi:hypothetical protein
MLKAVLTLSLCLITVGSSLTLKSNFDYSVFSAIRNQHEVYIARIATIIKLSSASIHREERMTYLENLFGDSAAPDHLWGSGFTRKEDYQLDRIEIKFSIQKDSTDSLFTVIDTCSISEF